MKFAATPETSFLCVPKIVLQFLCISARKKTNAQTPCASLFFRERKALREKKGEGKVKAKNKNKQKTKKIKR